VAIDPETAGLCGCWQLVAVWRQRQQLRQGKVVDTQEEYSFYATSLSVDEHDAPALVAIIRGHWSACEIGAHYRRDVSLGEDACRVRQAAQPLAALRNLVLGLFELRERQRPHPASSVPSWQRRMTVSQAIRLLRQTG
jgi:hypothetical protein